MTATEEKFCQHVLSYTKLARINKNEEHMADKINIHTESSESAAMRNQRISDSCNGSTTRTRVVRDKTKYTRKTKHKKGFN